MREELDQYLCKVYPKIFKDRAGDPTNTLMCFGFECGDGWFQILNQLCNNIQHYLDWENKDSEKVPQVVAVQVKEKLGTLRFYYDGGNSKVDGMVRMAESMSGVMCEECGKPGETRHGGWIKVLCDEHEAERQKRQKERFGDE